MARVRHKRKPVAEMNVVPYIDVMLVLLVIFMVTAPMLNQGESRPAQGFQRSLAAGQQHQVLTISIKADKTYYWNLGSEVDPDQQEDKTFPRSMMSVPRSFAAAARASNPGLHPWRQVCRLRRGHGRHGRVAEGRCR
jgi:biopolymer transport protein TolR